jgi:hypothetical protein
MSERWGKREDKGQGWPMCQAKIWQLHSDFKNLWVFERLNIIKFAYNKSFLWCCAKKEKKRKELKVMKIWNCPLLALWEIFWKVPLLSKAEAREGAGVCK